MAYRNKTYVCFDADNDIRYYRLMQAWKQNDHTDFNFLDAHDLTNIMPWSTEESIKASLAERLRNTKVFVVLVGEKTRYLYKFVRWEIEQALKRDLPVIAVNLNALRYRDDDRCPPLLRDELAVHISFNAAILQHALETWEGEHKRLRGAQTTGPHYYRSEIYTGLGL